ncbi:MAG: hypothetical protein GYA46_13645, partial [candidate division Zixibacteria bacterium]|nr:hypothetical protein [candidate division Zixibacteria bacterium]
MRHRIVFMLLGFWILTVGFAGLHAQGLPAVLPANEDSWSPIGLGTNGIVYSLAVYNNSLIAGGQFSIAGGTAVSCIAAWNGTAWVPLGAGMNGIVQAMIVFDNKLIAGGQFTTAGGEAASYIAAWDGASWSPLGTGMDGFVEALVVY